MVIGNGFDVAHGLDTKYEHFYNACLYYLEEINKNELTKCYTNIDVLDEFTSELKNKRIEKNKIESNLLIRLIKTTNMVEGKWQGLETLLTKTIDRINRYEETNTSHLDYQASFLLEHRIDIELEKVFDDGDEQYFKDRTDRVIKTFSADLDFLICLLNIYLKTVMKCTKPNKIKDISDIINRFEMILNYNYTDTFEELYSKSIKTIHIHGSLKGNNITLGTSIDINAEKEKRFYHILKKFQRLENNNDILYIDNKYKGIYNFILFYGCSFSMADKDSLSELINLGMPLVVHYYDEKGKIEIIKNLYELLLINGKDMSKMIDNREIILIDNLSCRTFIKFLDRIDDKESMERLASNC